MEEIEQTNAKEEKTEILQAFRDKLDDFKKAPFSLKAGLALVAVMASLGSNEINAEEIEQDSDAKTKFEQVYQQLSEQFNEYDWSAENTFISETDEEEKVIYDFPDFPQSGSGTFEMSSHSAHGQQATDGEAKFFGALTQQFGVDGAEDLVINPEGESFTIDIKLNQDLDTDFQIVDAISDEIGVRYFQDIDTELTRDISSDGETVGDSIAQNTTTSVSLPIANWSVENITDDEGNVTGYSVTIQPGEVVE